MEGSPIKMHEEGGKDGAVGSRDGGATGVLDERKVAISPQVSEKDVKSGKVGN